MPRAAGVFAVLLFVSLSAAVWAIGHGIPFGSDATSRYATYLSANNATHVQGVSPLVDDVSTSAEHPQYDPHAPHLLARTLSVLLIRSGVTDLRLHDALAVAISAVGIVLAFKVLRRMAGVLLAATSIVLFSLHYLGVLSGTSSLDGAFQILLFWGNLSLLQRYFDRPTNARLAYTAIGYALAFTSDLTFGVFVLLTALLAAWQLDQPTRTRAGFMLAAIAAAAVAVACWLAVVAAVVGPAAIGLSLPRPDPVAAFVHAFSLRQGALTLVVYAVVLVEIVTAVRSGVRRHAYITLSTFIVAAGLAAILFDVSPPSSVFVEDVILASVALTVVRHVDLRQRRRLAAAYVGLLAVAGVYWLGVQAQLAVRYPPTESALAALGGNAMLTNASLVAADSAPIVWYYTRANVLAPDVAGGQFLVCSRDCAQLPVDARNLSPSPRYQLYALASGAAPSQVALTTTPSPDGYVAHVTYGEPAAGSIVRLYVQTSSGAMCLLDEGSGQADFRVPHVSSGRLVAGVVPPNALAAGVEYLSPPVEVRATRLFELPNTKMGGTQQIQATSLDEAEQIAIQRGTWAPGAGTLGDDAVTALTHYPDAEDVCRGATWDRR